MDPTPDQRDRLKQVEQTDLTESRVNQDFVDWLRKSGPSWLLAILIVLVAIVGWSKYKEYKVNRVAGAFFELNDAADPETLELVAEDNRGIHSVSELARLSAGDAYLFEALSRRDFSNPEPDAEPLTDDEVSDRIKRAREQYTLLLDATKDDVGKLLFTLQARLGLAAVAESLGEFDEARRLYDDIEAAAEGQSEIIRQQAIRRRASLDSLRDIAQIPGEDDVPVAPATNKLIRDLLPEAVDPAPGATEE